MDARVEDFSFPSADGSSRLHGMVWTPALQEGGARRRPRAVVQLVHGMCEHISRYDEFARYLAGKGFAVVGHDQLGHGSSCPPQRWGMLPCATGADTLLADVDSLRAMSAERFGEGVPHFLFGHSMGSFVTRVYVSRSGSGLAGAVICGTGFVPPTKSRAGHAAARLVCLLRGEDHKSELLHGMADGAYSKAIPDAETPFDWLSHDRRNVRDYVDDPACGFLFSAGGYATLTELTAEACSDACAKAVPHDLPLYFVAGADDPVGDCGRGVERSYRQALDAGSWRVAMRLWPDMRHEILREAGRQEVFEDLARWMEEQL